MTTKSNYSIVLRSVKLDGEDLFEARVREFPDIVSYGETVAEAHNSISEAIEMATELLVKHGHKVPPPIVEDDEYSGRLTFRAPKSLHRELHLLSTADGVSLNQLMISGLTYYVGHLHGVREEARRWTSTRSELHSWWQQILTVRVPSAKGVYHHVESSLAESERGLVVPASSNKWQQ